MDFIDFLKYECNMRDDALKRVRNLEKFAEWVANEIFDDMWEHNKDSFAEVACRKLSKVGLVKADGDKWILVQEEDK